MKLLSVILLLVSVSAFAGGSEKVSEGAISVHNLHCVINTRPVRTESTVLKSNFAEQIHIIGLEPETLQLKHKELRGEGCDEMQINEIIDASIQSFGYADVNVQVVTTVEEIRTNRHCYDLVREELSITFPNGLKLNSSEAQRAEVDSCN